MSPDPNPDAPVPVDRAAIIEQLTNLAHALDLASDKLTDGDLLGLDDQGAVVFPTRLTIVEARWLLERLRHWQTNLTDLDVEIATAARNEVGY
ncbi:MAG: hypothetical protein AAF467_24625 [Actinomycetota bacterium]